MVVSSPLSKLSKFSTASSLMTGLDLPFESLSLMPPTTPAEELHPLELELEESDEDTESFDEEEFLFPESDEAAEVVDKSASHYYGVGGARPDPRCKQHEHEASCDIGDLGYAEGLSDIRPTGMDPGCGFFRYYDRESSPVNILTTSPTIASKRRSSSSSRRGRKSSLSVRESLLAEAWERKRELMLHEELANIKERAKPELLGRSSSDCGSLIVDASTSSELRRSRTRSLTNDDFEELRGCIDLGFRFDQSSIPDLCDTLPALEVYCAVAQNLQESPNCMSPASPDNQSPARCSSPSANPSWKISSPGDDPKVVKGRLRHWAQAVACDARLWY